MVDKRRDREELLSVDKEGKRVYKPNAIEPKWQKVWNKEKIYSPNLDSSRKPFYNLMMFPYPSAEGMHVGNMYAFTGADVYGRFKRMQGNDVFEPIGLDGFGIHSENYAIRVGRHPKDQAKVSESNFYRQLRATGNGFDWSRKLETYDPKYYKWTQWLFIQLFKAGLAYRKKAKVNWCPSCKTVLADEQVIQATKVSKGKNVSNVSKGVPFDTSGTFDTFGTSVQRKEKIFVNVCERCETEVVKKDLEQWFFRITHYAEKLLGNIEKLNWSEKVKTAQRAWIGRSEGALITFKIKNSHRTIDVFTTRPDTLFGATFLVVSPEHPLVADLFGQGKDVMNYVSKAVVKSEQERIAQAKEKEGVPTWYFAVNPVNNQEIPVWIADYVLMGYGTGAIMGVPAHDQRDYEFAKKYNLPIRQVILRPSEARGEVLDSVSPRSNNNERKESYAGEGTIVNSGEWNGWYTPEAIDKVIDSLEKKGRGKKEITYHLRDWLISRQRYWGPPIPMIYCENCAKIGIYYSSSEGARATESRSKKEDSSRLTNVRSNNNTSMAGWFPVPEKDLPVFLPDVEDWKPTGTGKSPLASVESFVNTKCPNCKKPAKRETDVSDTFLDSSWYFLRYLGTEFDDIPFPIASNVILNSFQDLRYSGHKMLKQVQHDIGKRRRWLPVAMYIGGAEHSVLHLLYSRFITMVLHDLGYISFQEPFNRFFAHGLLIKERAKMSKSKGNVVVPDEYIRKFGADTLRMYLMFLGPFNQGGDFYDSGIEGMFRFLNRVYRLISEATRMVADQNAEKRRSARISVYDQQESARMMHKTIKKVTEDIEHLRYNTAIASLMEWHNYLSAKFNPSTSLRARVESSKLTKEEAETFLRLLAPFAPHMTEELWSLINADSALTRLPSGQVSAARMSADNQRQSAEWSIHCQPWPSYNPKFLEEDEVTIVVQVNGRVRETIKVESGKLKVESYVQELARKSGKIKKYIEGRIIEKVVYVEGKVINFVLE